MKRKRHSAAKGPTYKIFKSKISCVWTFRVPTDIRPNTLVVPYVQDGWEGPDEKYYLGFRCSNRNEFVRGLVSRIKGLWDFRSSAEHDNLHVGRLDRIMVQKEEGSSEWTSLYEDPDCKPLTWCDPITKGEKLRFNLIYLDDIPPAIHTDTHVKLLIEYIGRKYGLPNELSRKIWDYVAYTYNFIRVYRPKRG